jgi:hypothetical protein
LSARRTGFDDCEAPVPQHNTVIVRRPKPFTVGPTTALRVVQVYDYVSIYRFYISANCDCASNSAHSQYPKINLCNEKIRVAATSNFKPGAIEAELLGISSEI